MTPAKGADTGLVAAVAAVRERLASRQPEAAITLGSGLGGLAEEIADPVVIPYGEIQGFPDTGVVGHKGELICGNLGGATVLAQSGRFHLYEGHGAALATLPVRMFAELGITTFIVTNAAGGIRRSFGPGTLMCLADHINLTFRNPLFGPVLDGEERFPDMSQPYDHGLRVLAHRVAADQGITLEDGVYAAVPGPSYETAAEVRMLERLGADAVGMSTVPEVIAARARGMRVLGFSTITNPAAGMGPPLDHSEVMEVGAAVASDLARLIKGVIADLDRSPQESILSG